MKIIRLTVFLALFYFLVPFDLYITSTDYRIGYYGTAFRSEMITFSEDANNTFKFDLTNCEVLLYPEEKEGNEYWIDFGYEFNTYVEFNSSYLRIDADPTNRCIVELYLPLDPIPLPLFRINMTGTQDNIVFDDRFLEGAALNFDRGLEIFGETAFVYL